MSLPITPSGPQKSAGEPSSSRNIREDTVRSSTTIREMLVRLWPYFRRQPWLLVATIFAIVSLAVVGRFIPTLFGYAVDEGLLKKNNDVIVLAAGGYLILELIKTVLLFLHSYLFSKIGNRVLYELRADLIRHTQSLPISFFDKNPTGRIVTRVTSDIVSLGELFTQGIVSLFSSTLSLVTIVTAMTFISVKMTLACLALAPPLLWFSFHLTQKIRFTLRESKKRLAAINAFVAENISGMKVLQLYNRIDHNRARFQELTKSYRDIQQRSVVLYGYLWPTVNFFNATSVAMALYFGGWSSATGAVSTGAMVAFILHVRDFINPLRTILEKYQIFQNSLSGAERIFTLLDEAPESNLGAREENVFKGEIEFRHLNFRYDPELPAVLQAINLKIRAGESVAIVGRTGSGKSTMISLLQRFYDYSEGEILIDGVPLSQISRRTLRSRLGVVQQDTFMFRGTIAQNIGLDDPRITMEAITNAATRAGCDRFIERHPNGFSAHVEERGANLSFGERQLLAFARILAFNPDILILDEATASIDSQSEAAIQEATREVCKGRTSIIIAHRISTVMDCDRIVVLDGGKIVEVGSHADLMAKSGLYFQLCQSQFRQEPELAQL